MKCLKGMETSTAGVDANRFSFECKSGYGVLAGSRDSIQHFLRSALRHPIGRRRNGVRKLNIELEAATAGFLGGKRGCILLNIFQ